MNEHEFILQNTIAKAKDVFGKHRNIIIAYSGGADSDVVIDFIHRFIDTVKSVMFDTGVEFQATLDHVREMQSKYEIAIVRATRPVPTSNKKFGYPFLSKYVSEMLERLQRHNFKFQQHGNLTFDELYTIYPRCKSALRWWCDEWGDKSRFSIERHQYLKEFLIENDLPFRVSGKCCYGAKIMPSKTYAKDNGVDLFVLGMRRSEGGVRSIAYQSCYQKHGSGHKNYAQYFPLFFWDADMMQWYKDKFDVHHSKAYSVYGLSRTGCAACPFASGFDSELAVLAVHEPKKHKYISATFAPSHDYRRRYYEYKFARQNTPNESLHKTAFGAAQLVLF